MSGELIALRLALLGIIFAFILVTWLTMVGSPGRPRRRERVRPAWLVVLDPGMTGLAPGERIALIVACTLGRDRGNGIALADASISSRHATFSPTGRRWRVRDLGSTNGTVVNGRVTGNEGVLLRPGDEVAVGAVVLQFTDRG